MLEVVNLDTSQGQLEILERYDGFLWALSRLTKLESWNVHFFFWSGTWECWSELG